MTTKPRLLATFPPCLVAGALSLSACQKDEPRPVDGATTQTTDQGEEEQADDESDSGNMTGAADTGTTGFVPMMEDMIDIAECDPWAQDCPEGEKCVAYGSTGGNWDRNKCVTVMGSGQEGDPCTYSNTLESTDDCGPDTWCWNVNMDNVGTCTPFCEGNPDNPLCDPGFGCTIANEGSINLCLQRCDPLLQDCQGEDICFYDFSGNFVCVFGTDMIPTGEPCGFINDCAAGNICLDATVLPSCNDANCCGAFCDLANPTCELQKTECTAFFDQGTAPPGYESVGVCIIPGA
jgi:hypothetical protein